MEAEYARAFDELTNHADLLIAHAPEAAGHAGYNAHVKEIVATQGKAMMSRVRPGTRVAMNQATDVSAAASLLVPMKTCC